MTMTIAHVQHRLTKIASIETSQRPLDPSLHLRMYVGAGGVDPDLIGARDRVPDLDVEDVIAFRCSCL